MGTEQQRPYRWYAAHAVLVASCALPVQAQEYVRDENPAPDSVEELDGQEAKLGNSQRIHTTVRVA